MTDKLSHIDADGTARMVNVGDKATTDRRAVAVAEVHMAPETLRLIAEGNIKKGDVLGVARLAGIMAAKQTSTLIPLCHPLPLESVNVDLEINQDRSFILVTAEAKVSGKTGVEMEALTAATISALTVYDMAKAVDRGMTITNARLVLKEGGKSGTYRADDAPGAKKGASS